MNVQLTPNLSLTTTHPLSLAGKPVLVFRDGVNLPHGSPEAFLPFDMIKIFNRTAPAAYWAHFYGKNLTGAERDLIAEYLRQWSEGPQLE